MLFAACIGSTRRVQETTVLNQSSSIACVLFAKGMPKYTFATNKLNGYLAILLDLQTNYTWLRNDRNIYRLIYLGIAGLIFASSGNIDLLARFLHVPFFVSHTYASASRRSSIMSCQSSKPMASRTPPGSMPRSRFSSSGNAECVIE